MSRHAPGTYYFFRIIIKCLVFYFILIKPTCYVTCYYTSLFMIKIFKNREYTYVFLFMIIKKTNF